MYQWSVRDENVPKCDKKASFEGELICIDGGEDDSKDELKKKGFNSLRRGSKGISARTAERVREKRERKNVKTPNEFEGRNLSALFENKPPSFTHKSLSYFGGERARSRALCI